jgi:hypothetical protein
LNELESQNDGQVEGIMGKVRQLKDVSLLQELPFAYTISRTMAVFGNFKDIFTNAFGWDR